MKYSNCAKCGGGLQDFSTPVANKHFDQFSEANCTLGSTKVSLCWIHGFGSPSLRWCHSRVLYRQQQPSPVASRSFPVPYLHPVTELAITTCSCARNPCPTLFQHLKPKQHWRAMVAHLHAGQGQLLHRARHPRIHHDSHPGTGELLRAATEDEVPHALICVHVDPSMKSI